MKLFPGQYRVFTAFAVALLLAVPFRVASVAAPCTGDCDDNMRVTIDEILTMVDIALGNPPGLTCAAGDADGNGQITVDEILTAVNSALTGCPPAASSTATPTAAPPTPTDTPAPTGSPTVIPTETPSVVTLQIGTVKGSPGNVVSFTVSLGTAGEPVAATSNVIQYDPSTPIRSANGNPDCQSLSGAQLSAIFDSELPRAGIVMTGNNPLPDGSLYSCNVQIAASAVAGAYPLLCSRPQFLRTDNSTITGGVCLDGQITVESPAVP